eukprot:403369515
MEVLQNSNGQSLDFDQSFPILSNIMISGEYDKLSNIKHIQEYCSNIEHSKKSKKRACTEYEDNLKHKIFPLINEEIEKFLPDWRDLLQINDQHINCHTINVFYCLINDQDYRLNCSSFERNVLKWAALMHDLKKLSHPFIEGKDHMHPFKGGKCCLENFQKLGLIQVKTQNDLENFERLLTLINESKQPIYNNWRQNMDPKKSYCLDMHGHHLLSEIFTLLWRDFAPRGSFVDLIFRLVFFHQSLPGLIEIPPMVQMSPEERLIYCDTQFFKLIKILMKNDSLSYMFIWDYDGMKHQCMCEFEDANTKVAKEYKEKRQILIVDIGNWSNTLEKQ